MAKKEIPKKITDMAAYKKNEDQPQAQPEPKWIYYDDKGNRKVDTLLLAKEVMAEIPIVRLDAFTQGARFDQQTGSWRMNGLDDFLDGYITDKLEKQGKWSQQKLAAVKKFILIKTYNSKIKGNPFDRSDPNLINFQNGTYNLKNDTLTPHNPKDYIFQSHEYKLCLDKDKTPVRTIKWLLELTGNEHSVDFLMQYIGYCFYRSYTPFQAIAVLIGSGSNGKSSFINFLTKVLNNENVANITLQDLSNKSNRFVSSQLYQKEANMFADIDSEFIKSTGILKSLTGNDSISAEFKGHDPFMFRNFAKLLFSANELPSFSDFSVGFERRLYVVPFVKTIDESFKKRHNLTAIEAEIPNFAYQCLQAFKKALTVNQLIISEPMKTAKDKWMQDANHVTRFIDEYCYIDTKKKSGDTSRNIYNKYKDFCFEENLKPLSQPRFTKQLEKIGIFKQRARYNGTNTQRYVHLFLNNDYDADKDVSGNVSSK